MIGKRGVNNFGILSLKKAHPFSGARLAGPSTDGSRRAANQLSEMSRKPPGIFHRPRKAADLAIAATCLGYVIIVLWTNLECPLFAWLLVGVAGYQLVKGRAGKREPARSRLVEGASKRRPWLERTTGRAETHGG